MPSNHYIFFGYASLLEHCIEIYIGVVELDNDFAINNIKMKWDGVGMFDALLSCKHKLIVMVVLVGYYIAVQLWRTIHTGGILVKEIQEKGLIFFYFFIHCTISLLSRLSMISFISIACADFCIAGN